MKLWIVIHGPYACIVESIIGIEDAKRKAQQWLGGATASYEVRPLVVDRAIQSVVVSL